MNEVPNIINGLAGICSTFLFYVGYKLYLIMPAGDPNSILISGGVACIAILLFIIALFAGSDD